MTKRIDNLKIDAVRTLRASDCDWENLKIIAIATGHTSRNDLIRKTIKKIIAENQETLKLTGN